MTIASGNVINRENIQGVDYPFGVRLHQAVGYILLDPEELPQTEYWVYEEDQLLPTKEKSRKKVKLPKGLHTYLYGIAIPRGIAPLQAQSFTATSHPLIYTVNPLTGLREETGIGGPTALSAPIPIGPMLTKIYDPLFPLNEISESKNAWPLPGFDAGAVVPLTENSYLKISTGSQVLLSAEVLKLKKSMRCAVVFAGWMKDDLSVSINDIGGWSTNAY
jgi:hypothetical protein